LQVASPFDPAVACEAGTLCYAHLAVDASKQPVISATGKPKIDALYPVMISRELGCVSPEALLAQLKPATSLDELSPADRVFGWANQKGDGAWRGQLRIHPLRCIVSQTHSFGGKGLPIPILSAPKKSQARFYVAEDKQGSPLKSNPETAAYFRRSAGSPPPEGLRGRKVYPHHRFAEERPEYWKGHAAQVEADREPPDPAEGESTLCWDLPFREYVRRKGKEHVPQRGQQNARIERHPNRDTQNRSIEEWVAPGAVFETEIDVINLNEAELGALLWLLSLPDNHYHRLGGGKPLGFGSVRITLTSLDLANGLAKRREYSTLIPGNEQAVPGEKRVHIGRPGAKDVGVTAEERKAHQLDIMTAVQEFITEYKRALVAGYVNPSAHMTDESERQGGAPSLQTSELDRHFKDISFIKAFLQAASGFSDGLPVHYPRMRWRPDPAGKNYEWFVENNKAGKRLSLGALADGDKGSDGKPGLPYWK
jgi:CRISPR-associated protein (TIGR03986 family)